jgi:PAS domain S-box-containing protein
MNREDRCLLHSSPRWRSALGIRRLYNTPYLLSSDYRKTPAEPLACTWIQPGYGEALMNTSPHHRSEPFLPEAHGAETNTNTHPPKWVDVSAQSLLDAAPDAMLVATRAGEIVAANLQAEKLFGCGREELIGRSVESLISSRPRPERSHHRQDFFGDPHLRPMGTGLDLFALRKNATEVPVEITLSPVTRQDGTFVVTAIRDATDRRRAEGLTMLDAVLRETRESEERFSLIADAAPALIWMSGTDMRRTYFNGPWLEFTGRSVDSELGNGWAEGVHPQESRSREDACMQASDRREEFKMEYRLRRYDGEYRWILDTGVPRFNQDGSFAGYVGIGIDVTDRKQAEEALASVSHKLIEAQEQERTRIARELHDDIGQRLAFLAIELEQLQQSSFNWSEVRRRISELQKQTSQIATDVQLVSHELHSSRLDYLGLAPAMRGFCQEFGEQQRVEIDFKTHDLPNPMPPDISLCLFRVLQEALHNSAKHSGARRFKVRLWGASHEIHLTVSDSGAGFILEAARESQGLGLISMEERVKCVKGTFSIHSQPKRGTRIHACVPLTARSDFIRAAGRAGRQKERYAM